MANKAIKLNDETYNRLKVLGEARKRTPHWLMKTAIEQFVEKEEAYEAEKREDLQRWENYKLTGKVVAHSEVKKWLESWGTEKELPCPK